MYKAMADYAAACNIAARVPVNEPMAVPVFTVTASHSALARGS